MKQRTHVFLVSYGVRILSILVILSFVLSAYVLNRQNDISRDSRERQCLVSQDNRTVLRNVLQAERDQALAAARTPDEAERQAIHFEHLLELVPVIDCNKLTAP